MTHGHAQAQGDCIRITEALRNPICAPVTLC